MSKRTRTLKQTARRQAAALTTTGESAPSAAYYGAMDYAGNDEGRGRIWFPYSKSKDHLKGYSLTEARRISQWAAGKTGIGRMATRFLARKIGAVTMAAATADEKFNAAHSQWWQDMYGRRAGNYDVSRKFTAGSFMGNALNLTFRDGDVGLAHVTGPEGEPLVMAVEASLIKGGEGENWCDGVKVGPNNEHLAYHVCTGEGKDEGTTLSAADMVLLANYETHASVRGAPALFATLDRVRDVREVDNSAIKAAKIQALVAFYVQRVLGASTDPIGNFGGKQRKDNLAAYGTQTTAHAGAPSNVPRKINEVFTDSDMADLPPGAELKTINDGRDYSAQTPLKEDIYRQIAWGVGLDEHNLLGTKGLSGPEVRKVNADFQEWRYYWLDAQVSFLIIDYIRRTEWAIRTRQLPRPNDPRWWACAINYPKSSTIDDGRDANGQEKRLNNALTNLQTEFGEQGENWKPAVDQWLTEKQYIKARAAELGISDMIATPKNAAAPPPEQASQALHDEITDLKSSLQLIMEKLQIG